MANKGVLSFELTVARNLKINPSVAIAYNTRGKGNMEPNKLI